MTHVVITGAGALSASAWSIGCLHDGRFAGSPSITRLTVNDINLPAMPADPRLRGVRGSLGDAAVRDALCTGEVDVVLHLAAVPGGAAEANSRLGLDVNVIAPMAFFEALGQQATSARPPPGLSSPQPSPCSACPCRPGWTTTRCRYRS